MDMTSYASSSSSTTTTTTRLSQGGYDVFLSFRGEDTRTGFTSHLYEALIKKRIRTYKDDRSLEIGNFIAPSLLDAIEASRFAIVILSTNFATSKWCLEEVAKVVDCMERGKLIVIPVFYHVDPSDVRHQTNCFKQGFANHEVDPGITPQKVATWRSAFAKVGAIKGSHVTPDKNESEIVSEILRRIMQDMQDASPVDLTHLTKGLVGIESRLNEVIRILNMESSEVRFIGICGMSGIGKTTLAEVVFECIQDKFQESSFIGNIKDISKVDDSDLCKLQQKILDDVLKDESMPVRSVKHGQTLLMTKLRDLKVLIVLDDVNHADQFMYLAGGREWFGPGTRIIVTTTNADLLNACRVNEIVMCEELKDEEAFRLFCQSAFPEGHPTHGYEKLSDDIVKYAGGLPIAITVYGSLLCGKEEKYWKEILKKVEEYPDEKVVKRLEVGYVRLDINQRRTFMYIACFLKGRDIDLVKDILTDIGLYSESGITDLIYNFLITINFDDCVWMHDLLQQMCWEILRKESEYNEKQIAIKYRQDVLDILSSKPKESRTIEIINQEPHKVEVDDCIDDPSCFSKMRKLKFLRISNISFPQGLNYLSNDLRILEWYGCSLKSLPPMFEPKHIYQLEMCYSQLETLWEKNLDLPNLRSIDLSFSKDLTIIPDLTSTPNLVKLNLEGCTKLKELHESVLFHKILQYINLSGCTRLQSLGRSNMEMEALVTLLLSGCSNLEHVPEFGDNMKCLEHLYVDGTNIKKLPESLGELCNLRKLDASETSIQEIPLSIHYLKRLRLLRVHRCQLSSQSRGFLFTKMEMLSSGLRELDLSYCNLSAVPDCIGLLHQLVNLDLSGNDFTTLSANISLLSNLRTLCLNNCKRLQSIPKLSVVNEDTLFGRQMRFIYIISEKRVDASTFHATSNNTCPIVSCLNCPKVAENERGGHMVERILNSYLQLRTRYWITPEAVFELIGVGSEIPSGFKLLRSDESLTLVGSWIGVALCAVVALHHIGAAMGTQYVVTAHIHVGERYWRIPVPINFLAAGLENQLVFYWTRADDLQRTLDSSQKNNFKFSFSVEPQDGNVQVTNFGVHFINRIDIMQLKTLEDTTTGMVHHLFRDTFSPRSELQWYMCTCENLTFINYSHSSVSHDLMRNITAFISDYEKQQYTLDDMYKIFKCLIEINQEVLREFKEEWSHTELFPLFYNYHRIIHGISELYNGFLRLLKEASYSWFSVKLALEQIVARSRTDDNYSYREMVEQLNDLEASEGIRFGDNFITSFTFLCKQTVAFSRQFNKEIHGIEKFKSVNRLAKVSSITVAGILQILATYTCTDKQLQELKGATSYSMWLDLIHSFVRSDKRSPVMRSYRRELRIWDFFGCTVVVQELKMKMARFSCFTRENEEEMMIAINKLEKKIDNISVTIEYMSRHAHRYSLDTRKAVITLNQFFVDSNLQLSVAGFRFMPFNEEEKYENPMREAMTVLYGATLSLIYTDLHRYISACKEGDDPNLLSCHSIHDNTSIIISIICGPRSIREGNSLNVIHKAVTCLHEINQEGFTVLSKCKEEWRLHPQLVDLVIDYLKISLQTSQLYNDLVRLLKGQCDSRLSIILRWKELMVNLKQDYNFRMYKEEMVLHVNDDGRFTLSGDFMKSLADVCEQIVAFTGDFDEDIKELKSVKILAKVSSGLVAGGFSVMAAYMVECIPFQWMPEKPLTCVWLHIFRCFSWNSPLRKIGQMVINDFYDIDSHLREVEDKIRSFLSYVKYKHGASFFAGKEDMMSLINTAAKKIDKLSVTIEDMSRHACKCNADIMKAGKSLGLIS